MGVGAVTTMGVVKTGAGGAVLQAASANNNKIDGLMRSRCMVCQACESCKGLVFELRY